MRDKIKKLVIIGAGGFGREVSWLVERINQNYLTWNLLGFVDDDPSMENKRIDGYPVIGNIEWVLHQSDELYVVCAVAKPSTRSSIIKRCSQNPKILFPILVSPDAVIGKNVTIGDGTIICSSTIITIDVTIGMHVIINLACTIGHDAKLNDFVTLYPTVNVSGHVIIGKNTEIGTGTQIIQGLSIGERTIVGAGSVVIRDIPSDCTAVGVPAKPIKISE